MPEDKLIAAIDSYAGSAFSDGGELSRQRSLALDAFAMKNIEPADEGRSQVTDATIFETVGWIMPSLMRIYGALSGDPIVEFDPTGPEDEDAAEQESQYLNYLVTQKNEWDMIARTWMQDALLTKNAYCLVEMVEKLQPETETYEGQTEEQLALLLDDDVEVVGQNAYQDPGDEGTLVDPMSGQSIESEEQAAMLLAQGIEPALSFRNLYDVQLKRVKATERLNMKVLPPERCKVGEDTPSHQIDDETNYFEFWDDPTISELRKSGFDVPDDIAESDSQNYDTLEDYSRDELLETDSEYDSPDPSMRKVIARHIWIRFDYDEDGIAELQYVLRVGDEILFREETNRIPVACIVPFINTHRHMGISVADALFDLQRICTAFLRAGLDGINLALNPRHAISTNVNIDDMLISRPGSVVRVDGGVPGEGHVMPLQTENTFPHAQMGLEYMDAVKEKRVGVSRSFTGIDAGALSGNNEHNAIGQLSTMASQRVEDIARVFAGGFKRLFSLAHELVIKSGRVDDTIRLRGEWVNIDPTQWRTGRDMRIVAPFAAGNKDALLQRLLVHKQIHMEALAGGLPIVDADDAYNLALEIAKATDIQGTKIYTDPATIPPQPEEPDYTGIALEIENKKADTAEADSQRDFEMSKYKADLDAEIEKYRADLNAQVQIALKELDTGAKSNLEHTKAALRDAPILDANNKIQKTGDNVNELAKLFSDSIKKLDSAIQDIKDDAAAPIKIVRENGRIVGKEVNGRFVPLEDAG